MGVTSGSSFWTAAIIGPSRAPGSMHPVMNLAKPMAPICLDDYGWSGCTKTKCNRRAGIRSASATIRAPSWIKAR